MLNLQKLLKLVGSGEQTPAPPVSQPLPDGNDIPALSKLLALNKPAEAIPAPTGEVSSNVMARPLAENPLPPQYLQPAQPLPTTPQPIDMRAAAPVANLSPMQKYQQELSDVQNKQYGIKTLPDGTVQRGKDRDSDHNWWDLVKGAGYGALQGLQSGGLGGALGGAIAGGISGGVDRNYDEKIQDKWRTSQILSNIGQQAEIDKVNSDQAIAAQKLYGEQIANQSGIIKNEQGLTDLQHSLLVKDPRWEQVQNTKTLSQEDADYFNKKLGTNLAPANWQAIKEETVGGVPFQRKEFDPNYKPNESLPVQLDKVLKTRTFNGSNYTLDDKSAAAFDIAISQGNATRAQQILIDNNRTAGDNAATMTKAEADKLKQQQDRDETQAKYQTSLAQAQQAEADADSQIAGIESQIANLPENTATLNPGAITQLQAQKAQLLTAKRKARADFAAANAGLLSLPKVEKPKVTLKPTIPQSGGKGGKNKNAGSLSDYERALRKIK